MKTKRIVISILALLMLVMFFSSISNNVVYANENEVGSNYIIFDENYNYLFEKSLVKVGDIYISKTYKKYEVIYVNDVNRTGIAKFIEQLQKPKVKISSEPSPITTKDRKIGLYCTHNDESYLPSEGYYSIYGKGGIHDIAKKLKTSFENMGIEVVFDETLHLPHDGSAYSRSSVTAKKLLNENELNAIFDIHRDGVSRSVYATNYNGQERSKIRIVVGKANPNMKKNEEFAKYLMAVADEMYPWLINDIYYASGHYNQALSEKALLFEMGTYLIEKELVMDSVEPLAHVINVALFNTTVDTETGELEIGGSSSPSTPTIDELFKSNTANSNNTLILGLLCVMFGLLGITIMTWVILNIIKKIMETKNNMKK